MSGRLVTCSVLRLVLVLTLVLVLRVVTGNLNNLSSYHFIMHDENEHTLMPFGAATLF